MSAILKQKLIDIANGFTKYGLWKGGTEIIVDSELNTSSENPVQNKVVTESINTLNSNLNYSSSSTVSIINIEGYKSRYNICNRDGDIVNVSCEVYDMSVVAAGVYFNIPEGYRPAKHIVNVLGYVEYDGSIQPSIFSIGTNGDVNISHGGGLTTQIAFACTYHI